MLYTYPVALRVHYHHSVTPKQTRRLSSSIACRPAGAMPCLRYPYLFFLLVVLSSADLM